MAVENKYGYLFGDNQAVQQAAAERQNRFQSWLDTRKQAVQQQRTSDVNMARYNALGNLLTTMVQPIGWAAGGGGFANAGTGGVQPYDNRAYVDAFNRAVKASDDLRNIGTQEGEYQFKLAEEEYRRQRNLEDEAMRYQIAMDKAEYNTQAKKELQAQQYELKAQFEQQKQENRLEKAEQAARLKYQYRTSGGKKSSKSETDKFISDAKSAYQQDILNPYYKAIAAGVQREEPRSFEDFLKDYAGRYGYTLTDGGSTGSTVSTATSSSARRSSSSSSPRATTQSTRSSGGVDIGL